MSHTVLIGTLAEASRAESLRRAIASVRDGNRTPVEVVVVVNGNRFDPALLGELSARGDVRLVQVPEAGLQHAILAGRQSVRSESFSFLDDDDEYLPGSVDLRVDALAARPDVDIVAVNGWRRLEGKDTKALNHLAGVEADPLRALFRENWMPSCGPAFRTERAPVHAFAGLLRHIHWSSISFRLALHGCRVAVVDEPAFIINDTPGSASKSETYLLCHVEVYQRMLAAGPPADVRAIVSRRLASARHEASDHFRLKGRWLDAWRWHLRSLSSRDGWQFLSYTRYLVWPVAGSAGSR